MLPVGAGAEHFPLKSEPLQRSTLVTRARLHATAGCHGIACLKLLLPERVKALIGELRKYEDQALECVDKVSIQSNLYRQTRCWRTAFLPG